MKKRLLAYTVLVLTTAMLFSSCKKDEIYSPKIQSPGQIQFQVTDALLTGTAFFGTVQPSYDVAAARFSRATATSANYAGGNIVVTANLSSNIANVTINYLTLNPASASVNPGEIDRETKATFTDVSGSITWTQAITTLTYKGVALANGSYTFEVVASNSDGSVVSSRIFTVTIIA